MTDDRHTKIPIIIYNHHGHHQSLLCVIPMPYCVWIVVYYFAPDDAQMKGASTPTPWVANTKNKWKKTSSIAIKIPPPPLRYRKSDGTKIASTISLSCSCQPIQPFLSCPSTSLSNRSRPCTALQVQGGEALYNGVHILLLQAYLQYKGRGGVCWVLHCEEERRHMMEYAAYSSSPPRDGDGGLLLILHHI